MNELLIFDTVRTPRGKGKRSGSLNEVTVNGFKGS